MANTRRRISAGPFIRRGFTTSSSPWRARRETCRSRSRRTAPPATLRPTHKDACAMWRASTTCAATCRRSHAPSTMAYGSVPITAGACSTTSNGRRATRSASASCTSTSHTASAARSRTPAAGTQGWLRRIAFRDSGGLDGALVRGLDVYPGGDLPRARRFECPQASRRGVSQVHRIHRVRHGFDAEVVAPRYVDHHIRRRFAAFDDDRVARILETHDCAPLPAFEAMIGPDAIGYRHPGREAEMLRHRHALAREVARAPVPHAPRFEQQAGAVERGKEGMKAQAARHRRGSEDANGEGDSQGVAEDLEPLPPLV